MGEKVEELALNFRENWNQNRNPSPQSCDLHVIHIEESESESCESESESGSNMGSSNNPFVDDWLPITESRNGNFFSCVFHLVSSGLGFQALLLPLAFSILGWIWGIICISVIFAWQLYTTWLLVHLHESVPGIRFSRFLHLAIASFGPKLGKLFAIFPVMYLSGGSCVITIITGGRIMELLFKLICDGSNTNCDANSLTGTEWFMIFTFLAIILAQRPNLNSITGFSLVASITAIAYFTLLWVSSIPMKKPSKVSHSPLQGHAIDALDSTTLVFNALAIFMLSFRGHNLVLEIQGTLPSNSKHPSSKTMWKAVVMSYILIATCIYPFAILEFWAYGNQVPTKVTTTSVFLEFYLQSGKKVVKFIAYILLLINCFGSFQIFAMPVFDNLEWKYTSKKKKRCSRLVRTGIRIFFGGLTFFISVAFPFLPALSGFIGGLALPLTYVHPCFMWISLKKPPRNSKMWCLNLVLGCLGVVLSICSVAAALRTLITKGLTAPFFKP